MCPCTVKVGDNSGLTITVSTPKDAKQESYFLIAPRNFCDSVTPEYNVYKN